MAFLELVETEPNWIGALTVAMTRPPGVSERRDGEDPFSPPLAGRPRRISDDLAWLRQALDEPAENGLEVLTDTAAVAAWQPADEPLARLNRLRSRGVLDAAGFLLHEPGEAGLPPDEA